MKTLIQIYEQFSKPESSVYYKVGDSFVDNHNNRKFKLLKKKSKMQNHGWIVKFTDNKRPETEFYYNSWLEKFKKG